MINVIIADDHAIVREGIKKIIAMEKDINVKAEAKSSQEVLSIIKKTPADILLLDITMPGRNGLEIIKDIRKEKPFLNILILSMHPEERYAIRAIKSGADGYLTKDSAADELIHAVRKVTSGKTYINPGFTDQLFDALKENNEGKLPHESLSNREFQVMCMLASGKTVQQVSNELSLGSSTISTYRKRILEKMKLSTNAELTYYAVTRHLID